VLQQRRLPLVRDAFAEHLEEELAGELAQVQPAHNLLQRLRAHVHAHQRLRAVQQQAGEVGQVMSPTTTMATTLASTKRHHIGLVSLLPNIVAGGGGYSGGGLASTPTFNGVQLLLELGAGVR